MGLALVTRKEYKDYMGINGTNQDGEIDSLIPKTSELVKTYCRRTFVDCIKDAKTDSFNGGILRFYPTEYPLIQTLSVETSTDFGANYVDMEEYVDYVFDSETQSFYSLNSTGVFPVRINGYRFTYFAGYEKLPEDLKLGIFDLITYYLKNDAVVKNLRVPTTQVMQLEYGPMVTNFPPHIARVLNMYKSSWD